MILSDYDINNMIKHGRLKITPFKKDIVRENGIDCRLDSEIAHHNTFGEDFVLDPSNEKHIASAYTISKKQKFLVIEPKEQVLMSTKEYISMPDDIAGFVELRSTWARHGFSMPPTIIDAGFSGNITLEVMNNAPYKIMIKPNIGFAHIIFEKLDNRTGKAYSGLYKNQKGIKLPQKIEWQ